MKCVQKGLKKYDYNIDMDMNTATLPKKGLKKYDYTMYMEKEDLKKLSKGQLIRLLLKQEKKKPKVVIVNDTKPKRPNRPPPPIPEGVKPFRPKQKIVDDRSRFMRNPKTNRFIKIGGPTYRRLHPVKNKPGFTRNPKTNRFIKIGGPTYRKVYPLQYKLDRIGDLNREINETSKPIENRYKKAIADITMTRMQHALNKVRNIENEINFTSANLDFIYAQVSDKLVLPPKITQIQKALNNSTKSFTVDIAYEDDPFKQLTISKKPIERCLKKELVKLKGFKYFETLKITFEKPNKEEETRTAFFNSPVKTIINETEIDEAMQTSRQVLTNTIEKWTGLGSGWSGMRVDGHYVNITKYKPMRGSSYIELPAELNHPNNGLVNLRNKDDCCFAWCHVRPQDKNPQRIKKSDNAFIKDKIVNYDGIEFPVTIKDYNKIEKMNNIRINVFAYEKQPYPIYISKEKFEDHMELLLITEGNKKHYVLIKDFNKLMYNQTKHKERKHFCMHCLQCFSSERVLNSHEGNCIIINGMQAVKMPTKDNSILKFNNYHKQQPVMFTIYADIEAFLQKVERGQPDSNESYTEKFQRHVDCGSAYKVVCCYDDKYSKDICIYRGEDAVYKFLEQMLEEVEYCKNVVKNEFNKPLKMTSDDELCFKLEEKCHICSEKYTDKDIRVRDHCHITGKYRGSAHQECNLKLRIDPEKIKIPVIFHNLRGYDSHFIMQQIGKITNKHTYKNKQMNINAIPNNMEKYMAFMLGNHLVFIDSFQFMSSSLDKLVNNLPKNDLKYTSQMFKGRRLELMTRKGVYPYDFMDSFEKFNQKELPAKEDFYSILNDQHISDEDYQHAKKVWNVFKCKNMGQYHDLYLGSDVLLLADVFENFRKTCLEYYKLDPCHYFTSTSLAWDALLKMTDIKLELMTDIDMFQFVEKGLRGGISYISHRHGLANNKYMKGYDEKAP